MVERQLVRGPQFNPGWQPVFHKFSIICLRIFHHVHSVLGFSTPCNLLDRRRESVQLAVIGLIPYKGQMPNRVYMYPEMLGDDELDSVID